MKRTVPIAIGVVIVAIVLFLPVIKVVVVPEWEIRVVDEGGTGQPDVSVRQTWNHYSYSDYGTAPPYGGEDVLLSDLEGKIVFPERSFQTSVFRWLLANIGSPLRWLNVHASTGPHAYFMCMNDKCSYDSPTYHGSQEELKKNTIRTVGEEYFKKLDDQVEQKRKEEKYSIGLPSSE